MIYPPDCEAVDRIYPRSKTRWSKDQIRRARQTPLKPILEKIGYKLEERKNGNYRVVACPPHCEAVGNDVSEEVIVKDHYWLCPERHIAGNSIDFFVKFRGTSFSKAMELLTS